MNIRKLKIENCGYIQCFEAVFRSDFIALGGINSETVASAIKLLIGGRLSKKEELLFRTDTAKLYAEVAFGHEEIYSVEIRGSSQTGSPEFRALKPDTQEDRTREYQRLILQSREEESSNIFSDFKKQGYPHKIKHYKDLEKYYPDNSFAEVTDGIGTTKTFRSYLKNYIRTYEPQRLRNDKEYLLILNNNGEFQVTHPNLSTDAIPCLSESEEILYHYLCFLSLSEFWYGIEQIKDMNHVRRPLLVTDLTERLDSAIDISDHMARTRKLGRQTFLILPCGDIDRIDGIKDAQIVHI